MPSTLHMITVSYNSSRELSRLAAWLSGLAERDLQRLRLTIIENGVAPTPTFPERVRKQTRAVTGHGNVGYLTGANLGLQIVRGEWRSGDWVLVCNPDISFAPGFIRVLLGMDSSAYGVVAPSIISQSTGVDLNPFLETRPDRAFLLRRALVWSIPLLPSIVRGARRRRSESRRRASVSRRIYAPHGAAFLLGGEFLAHGLSLQHPLFLYGEEITIAESCARAGVPVTFNPGLQVIHHEHASTASLRRSYQRRLQSRSARYAIKLLYGRGSGGRNAQ